MTNQDVAGSIVEQQRGKQTFGTIAPPEPSTYVYARDLDAPDILETGSAVGVKGNIKVAVVNDPAISHTRFDERQ